MKKLNVQTKLIIATVALALLFSGNVQAQLYAPEIKVKNNPNGIVGVNTLDPQSTLDVFGNIYVGSTNGLIRFRRSDGGLNGYVGFNGNDLYMQNTSGSGVIKFLANTDASGLQELMRIDGSGNGNVGIGITEPTEKLHIDGNIYVETNSLLFRSWYSQKNKIYSVGSSGPEGTGSWYFTSYYDNLILNAGVNGSNPRTIMFRTGQSEIMRIASDGEVGIGVTSPAAKLHVAGDVRANAFIPNSDRNLKKDIRDYNQGMNLIKQIHPVKFKFKPHKVKRVEIDSVSNTEKIIEEFEENNRDYVGVIAQDIQQFAPDLVDSYINDDNEEVLSVNYTAFTFMLINAVKEQQLLIEELQKEINTMKEANHKY